MLTTAMLLGLAWKSVIVAVLTLGLLRLARSRSAGERSMIAHAGLMALLALPAAILLLPQWAPLPAAWSFEPAAPIGQPATTGGSAIDPAPAATSVPVVVDVPFKGDGAGSTPIVFSWSDLAPFLYLVPLLLLSGVMALAVVRLFAMRGRAEILVERSWLSALAEAQRRMGFKHGTALLVSNELRSPISWGVLRSTIVLSPKAVAASGEAEAIIAHELAHVARLDWAKLLGARAACAVFWFNPLVWMLARESHQLREEAADDAVLMADINGPDYATLLVGAARHDNQGALLAAHGVSPG
ncbi:MAG: M56 family metallopeptidase, partial [Sphingopyxis sp.]